MDRQKYHAAVHEVDHVALPLCCAYRGSSSAHSPTQASSHTHSLIEPSGQLEGSPASPHSD